MFQTLTSYVHARTQSLDNNAKCVGTTFVPSDLLFGESTASDSLVRYLLSIFEKLFTLFMEPYLLLSVRHGVNVDGFGPVGDSFFGHNSAIPLSMADTCQPA